MSTQDIVALIGAFGGIQLITEVGKIIARRSAAARLAKKAASEESKTAFDLALSEYRADVARLSAEVDRLRVELRKAEEHADLLQAQVDRLLPFPSWVQVNGVIVQVNKAFRARIMSRLNLRDEDVIACKPETYLAPDCLSHIEELDQRLQNSSVSQIWETGFRFIGKDGSRTGKHTIFKCRPDIESGSAQIVGYALPEIAPSSMSPLVKLPLGDK